MDGKAGIDMPLLEACSCLMMGLSDEVGDVERVDESARMGPEEFSLALQEQVCQFIFTQEWDGLNNVGGSVIDLGMYVAVS